MTVPILYAAAPDSVPVIRCSPPSWAAQIALLEEGVAHELRWLRFDRGDHRSESMLRINPAGTVPVLVDGDEVVTDTVALLEHIVRRSPEERLAAKAHSAGSGRFTTAAAVKQAGMSAFRRLMTGDASANAWTPLQAPLDRWASALDATVEEFDIADVLVFVYVVTAQSLGLPTSHWPELEAFVARTIARPAVRTSWPSTWPPPSAPDT